MADLGFAVYLIVLSVSLGIGFVLGLRFFHQGRKWPDRDTIYTGFRLTSPYLLILFLIVLVIQAKNFFQDAFLTDWYDFTPLMYGIEGDITGRFQSALLNDTLTTAFIFIYIYTFAYILVFTPFFYASRGNKEFMRKYSSGLLLIYLVIIPFYFFFPVFVTSSYPDSGVRDVFYSNAHNLKFVLLIDRLDDCFPSGHMGVSLLTTILVYRHTPHKVYGVYCGISTVLIFFSAIYLGIHWVMDMAAGGALAVVVYLIIRTNWYSKWYERFTDRIDGMITF